MSIYDELNDDRKRCDRAVPALEDGKIQRGRWGQSPARTLCKDRIRQGDEDDECRPENCPNSEDAGGCSDNLVGAVLVLTVGFVALATTMMARTG